MLLNSSKLNNLSKFNHTFRGNFAFTLIELLVVIAIIGILSALIIIGMSSTTQKATIAKAQVFSNSLRNSLMGNLISEWKLEGNANDTWGINNGTTYSTTTVQDCVKNSCLEFDGSNSYIETNSASFAFSSTDNFSIELWSFWDTGSGMGTMYATVESAAYFIYFHAGYSDEVAWLIQKTGNTNRRQRTNSDKLIQGKWNHVVMTKTGDNDVKIYINTSEDTSRASQSADSNPTLTNRTWIGRVFTPDVSLLFNGKLDDVRVYNAAVPTSQIQQNYFVGLNKLFAKNQITKEEYNKRFADLKSNYAKE